MLSKIDPIKILLIGAGNAGSALIKLFDSNNRVEIIGVIDKDLRSAGIKLAQKSGILVGSNPLPFLDNNNLNLIINVTGDAQLQKDLERRKNPKTELLGARSAFLIWDLVNTYEAHQKLEQEVSTLKQEKKVQGKYEFIVGENYRMRELQRFVMQVAPVSTSVMILGETGTGKEVIARAIHEQSGRKGQLLVTVNCTAFSAELIESELFGHVKGAFTGAHSDKKGLLEIADKGTVFLDEIGDMPMTMQAKLLRFLQEGEIRSVGSTQTKIVDVRVLAATNRNLKKAIEHETFRADLYYRLTTFKLEVPALRERSDDIPAYAYHFLKLAQIRLNKQVQTISTEALDALQSYLWPGNLRELGNVIERAAVMADGVEI